MQLKCPSCGTLFDSKDYEGEFEIECQCGYKLLVPDEEIENSTASSDDIEEINFEDSPPAAILEEEVSLDLSLDNTDQSQDNQNEETPWQESIEEETQDGALSLTPSEELPGEMVYDPFEISSDQDEEAPTLSESVYEDSLDLADSEKQHTEDSLDIEQAEPNDESKSFSQQNETALIKSHYAKLGQFIGFSYKINWDTVTDEQEKKILTDLNLFIDENAWLLQLIEKQNIQLEELETLKMKALPEALASQLYLKLLELEIECQFEKANS